MDRLKGLPSFVVIVAVVFGGLRLAHVTVPTLFPETRQGSIAVSDLDEVRRLVGFAPMLPAYRPASLGERPTSALITFGSWPTLAIVWQNGEEYLSVTQRRGGPRPEHPPLARPFEDVPGSTWWADASRRYLLLERGEFWIQIETSLSARDLRRFADTLSTIRD